MNPQLHHGRTAAAKLVALLLVWLSSFVEAASPASFAPDQNIASGDFLVNSSEASGEIDFSSPDGIGGNTPSGFDGFIGRPFCHNDPVGKYDVLGLYDVGGGLELELLSFDEWWHGEISPILKGIVGINKHRGKALLDAAFDMEKCGPVTFPTRMAYSTVVSTGQLACDIYNDPSGTLRSANETLQEPGAFFVAMGDAALMAGPGFLGRTATSGTIRMPARGSAPSVPAIEAALVTSRARVAPWDFLVPASYERMMPVAPTRLSRTPQGITLELRLEHGMDLAAFRRKVGQLQYHVAEGNAVANLPHGVSDAARRSVTRAYRRELVQRIESMYSSNPTAMQNALQKLRQSDIDHILDLQLNGLNVPSNLKALHSLTNQLLGSQISRLLPVGQQTPIIGIRVIE